MAASPRGGSRAQIATWTGVPRRRVIEWRCHRHCHPPFPVRQRWGCGSGTATSSATPPRPCRERLHSHTACGSGHAAGWAPNAVLGRDHRLWRILQDRPFDFADDLCPTWHVFDMGQQWDPSSVGPAYQRLQTIKGKQKGAATRPQGSLEPQHPSAHQWIRSAFSLPRSQWGGGLVAFATQWTTTKYRYLKRYGNLGAHVQPAPQRGEVVLGLTAPAPGTFRGLGSGQQPAGDGASGNPPPPNRRPNSADLADLLGF